MQNKTVNNQNSTDEKLYFAMFTKKGNLAIAKMLDRLTEQQTTAVFARQVHDQLKAMEQYKSYSEATDSAVRGEVFEWLQERDLLIPEEC